MIFEFFFAILIALLLTAIFAMGFRRHGWGTGLVFFFLILFLATWAGGLWISPFGPVAWGVHWLSFLLVGIIIGLLLTALIPPVERPPYPESEARLKRRPRGDKATMMGIDAFLVILILVLIIAIVAAYYA